jgi:hypothetical protein
MHFGIYLILELSVRYSTINTVTIAMGELKTGIAIIDEHLARTGAAQ